MASRLTDEEVESLAWREIARAGRFIAQMRLFNLPILLTLAALLTYFDPAPWRVGLLGIVGLLSVAVVVRDFFWLRSRSIEVRHVPYFLSVIIAVQASLIAITGGVESPFFVILIVMTVLPAVVLGTLRRFVMFLLLPLSVVWFFTLGPLLGYLPALLPGYFSQGVDFAHNATYTLTQAAVMTVAMSLGGLVAIFLRMAITRGTRAVANARQELLSAGVGQKQELMALTGEIAHELKNPLASIQGLSSLVLKKLPQGSKEAEKMQVVLSEARRMGTTLEELLTFSRPVTRLSIAKVHLGRLLHDVVVLHEGLALKQGVTVTFKAERELSARCDPRKLKQAIANLLLNAIAATPTGGLVTLRADEDHPNGVRILVDDSGSGLSPEVKDRLFVPGITTKPEGSGIGLVIARSIAEQHGGSLTLKDRPQGGCRAELQLPPRTPQEDSEPTPEHTEDSQETPAS